MRNWTAPVGVVGRQAFRGLLLGSLTWGYALGVILVADRVLVPASGCEELDCLGLFVLPLATVPVVVVALVAVLRFRRPVLTFVLFLVAVGGLVEVEALPGSGILANLLLLAGAGALAAATSGSPYRRLPRDLTVPGGRAT